MGEFTKNQFNIEKGDCLKRGAWTIFRFRGVGEAARKKGDVFEWGDDTPTPVHTMYIIWYY